MDTSEIGRYGTVSFMKRLDPSQVVATFPIDDEQVTFGRDPHCNVRLYYDSVSLVHCKIIFQERKAFLVVLGTNGVVIDGCRVFPSTSSPTTIPLSNNSEIEIHSKCFRFTYPPKELRAVLLATPARGSPSGTPFRRRALRMSMIQSAQVFSPRPSSKPLENLRVLQTPLKPFKTPRKDSDSGFRNTSDESDDEQEVVLVDGDSPIVVQEEKDLVILENVEIEENGVNVDQLKTPTRQTFNPPRPQPSPFRHFPQPSTALQTPPRQVLSQTPRQRGYGSALHRAVLIRSAQRAVMQAETEKEDVEEEKEVEAFIAPGDAIDRQRSVSSSTSSEDGSEEEEGNSDVAEQEEDPAMSNWRHRFGSIDISSSNETSDAPEHDEEIDITDAEIPVEPVADRDEQIAEALESMYDRNSKSLHNDVQQMEEQPVFQTPTLPRRFTNFSTPQIDRASNRSQGAGRYSYGGAGLDNGGVRRVVVHQAWRVRDIVLPENTPTIKEEQEDEKRYPVEQSSFRQAAEQRRPPLSDEERKAIRERRRSALTTPGAFLGGQAPGMRRPSTVPTSLVYQPGSLIPPSPAKDTAKSEEDTKFDSGQWDKLDEDNGLDTRSLLEKMKETVEGMKRRKSLNPRMSLGLGRSPNKQNAKAETLGFSLLAPGVKEELEATLQLEMMTADDVQPSEIDDGQDHVSEDGIRVQKSAIAAEEVQDHDGDVGLQTPRPPSRRLMPTSFAHTPRMDDLKHVFGAPKVAATPFFKGMKHLFAQGDVGVSDTSIFEGIGEMLKTPEQYRYSVGNGAERRGDAHDNVHVDESQKKSDDGPVIPKRRSGRTRAAAMNSTTTSATQGELASEEEHPVGGRRERLRSVDGDDADAAKPKGRVLRGTKKTLAEDVQEEVPVKRGRSNPPEIRSPSQHEGGEESSKSELSLDDVEDTAGGQRNGEVLASASKSKPNPRRGRGRTPVTAESSQATSAEVDTLPAKSSRKRTPKTDAQGSVEPESEPQIPAVTENVHTTRMRSRTQHAADSDRKAVNTKSQRGTRSRAIEVEDDDPLDSIGNPETEMQEKSVEPAKTKRGTRSRTATKTVQEEGEVESTAFKKTSGKGSARPTSGRTEVASPPHTIVPDSEIDKENAEKVSKTRVSRTRKAGAVKVKEEESLEAAPTTRTTRVTRTRTRK